MVQLCLFYISATGKFRNTELFRVLRSKQSIIRVTLYYPKRKDTF